MLSMRAGAVALVVSGLFAGTAVAADIFVEPELAPEERIEEGWKVAITPRFWYFWETDAYFQVDNIGFQQSNETIDVPFAGGSISVTPPGLNGTTFSLTGLYGEGDGQVNAAFMARPGFPGGGFYRADVEMSRLDIEGIAQIPIAEGLTGILGARYIRFDRDEAGRFFDPAGVLGAAGNFFIDQDFYLGELGFGVTRPANTDGSLLFFGNLTTMVGYVDASDTSGDFGVFNVSTDDLDGGVIGIDTNAGAGLRLSENLLLSARYRLFYLSNPDFVFDEGGTFIHGPEANLTISFGG